MGKYQMSLKFQAYYLFFGGIFRHQCKYKKISSNPKPILQNNWSILIKSLKIKKDRKEWKLSQIKGQLRWRIIKCNVVPWLDPRAKKKKNNRKKTGKILINSNIYLRVLDQALAGYLI